MRLLFLKRVLACSALAGSVVGCGAHAPQAPVAPVAETALVAHPVSEDAFAASVRDLLLGRVRGDARRAVLSGVVARQLAHATERFEAGRHERGLSALRGAMYLARPGEPYREAFVENDKVLEAALRVVAPKGDEGSAHALLKLRASILPEGSPARAEVNEQLAALERWQADTRTGSPLEIAGRDQRVTLARALLEPTSEATRHARATTTEWIERAVEMSEDARAGGFMRPKRDETVEAFRAFRSGAKALMALSLRHGDANTALTDLERSSARRLVPQGLYELLERVASGGDAEVWRELLAHWIHGGGAGGEGDDPEVALDPELFRAAVWGMALEVLNRDEGVLEAAMPVAIIASQLGMPEVAPLVLVEGVAKRPEPQVVSAALGLVLQAIATEDDEDDAASARRVYRAAESLLAVSARPELRGKLHPSPARVRVAMAMVETKAGQLTAARPLLQAAADEEPVPEIWMMLAAIDRQAGSFQAALDDTDRALATPQAKQDPILAGEAHLLRYDLFRESGQQEGMGPELSNALQKALSAQAQAKQPAARIQAERLLSRVLERYGDSEGTARAIERAYQAAMDDKRQIAAIAIDAAARALVRKDVNAARFALTRALDAQLDEDDVVYVALWLSLVEKATSTRPDGSAMKALSGLQGEKWTGRLASWGLGKLKDQELIELARTPHQKTEASFYAAMARRIKGELDASNASLREIAKSSNIDLVEVRIARDLVDPPKPLPGGLPKGTKIP